MKKIKLLLLLLGVFILSGCNITKDSMEDIEIYTTIYPIKYLLLVYMVIMLKLIVFILLGLILMNLSYQIRN